MPLALKERDKRCFYCHYEEHLATDIQCPVIGVGETCTNAELLERYGTVEAAYRAYGM